MPTQLSRVGPGKRLLIALNPLPGQSGTPDPKLIRLLVRAHHLKEQLAREFGTRLGKLAEREKLSPSRLLSAKQVGTVPARCDLRQEVRGTCYNQTETLPFNYCL